MKLSTKLLGFVVLATTVLGIGASTTAHADSIYSVKPGDTLSQISLDYLGNIDGIQSIAQANNIQNVDLIFVGQKLNLTTDGKIMEATQAEVASQPEVATVEEAAAVANEASQPATEPVAEPVQNNEAPSGRQITVEATAYDGVSLGGVTASGYNIQGYGDKVIAVDPNVIPLGSTVYVPGYGTAVAADTGGAIQGNIIDLNMSTGDAINWGRRSVTITVL